MLAAQISDFHSRFRLLKHPDNLTIKSTKALAKSYERCDKLRTAGRALVVRLQQPCTLSLYSRLGEPNRNRERE
jgi:hypothetical protein